MLACSSWPETYSSMWSQSSIQPLPPPPPLPSWIQTRKSRLAMLPINWISGGQQPFIRGQSERLEFTLCLLIFVLSFASGGSARLGFNGYNIDSGYVIKHLYIRKIIFTVWWPINWADRSMGRRPRKDLANKKRHGSGGKQTNYIEISWWKIPEKFNWSFELAIFFSFSASPFHSCESIPIAIIT